MSQNNLIEIGSKANVILRFRQDTEVNGTTYKANEPYLLFKNANVLISYTNEDKSGSAARTVIANSEINPRTISVGSINLTRKLVSLLTCFSGEEENFTVTEFETANVENVNGDLFITPNESLREEEDEKIFIYTENDFTRLENVTYDAAQNRITSPQLEENKIYLVTYPSVQTGMKFSLNKNHVPYFSLEIQGVGNVDKVRKNVIMYFDKVSLNAFIEFTFIQDEIISVPLIFHIIENKNNYVWIEGEEDLNAS